MTVPILHCCWTNALTPRARCIADPSNLSDDERWKAERFVDSETRQLYIFRRGWLRQQLSCWLDRPPGALRFEVNAYGKPFIRDSGLGFSLSSSRSLVFLVVGQSDQIGCDIEYCDSAIDPVPIVKSNFAQRERSAYLALPERARLTAFYHAWTCKEAFLKAVGVGLSRDLDAFEVDVDPRRSARLLHGCDGFSVQSLSPEADFSAAIVAPGVWTARMASRISTGTTPAHGAWEHTRCGSGA